jgi:hypothetical protein
MSCELAKGSPGCSFLVNLKGCSINELPPAIYVLNVESGGVLEYHAMPESDSIYLQGNIGSFLKARERPLVRI